MPVNTDVEIARIRSVVRGIRSQDGTTTWDVAATEITPDALRVVLVMPIPRAPAPRSP